MTNNKSVLKGAIFVGLGASFYGMLATFVKLAYQEGFTTAEVTTAQYVLGILGLSFIYLITKKSSKKPKVKIQKGDIRKLIIAGSSYGGTSLFYYLSVQYINVSIAIVLLMQSVWLSVVLESILNKEFPSKKKIFATIIVLFGTLLATNAIHATEELDIRGIFWGIMAALSYTTTMFTANKIANYLPASLKSIIMLSGGAILIFSFLFFAQLGPFYFDGLKPIYTLFSDNLDGIKSFDYSIFYTYGLILSIFGTILPPLLMNKGFPLSGLGLGSIVSSMELPVSVTMAFILLSEKVLPIQWGGIALIILAVMLMNLRIGEGKEV